MYADDIRVSRLRRHGLKPPDDPDIGLRHTGAWLQAGRRTRAGRRTGPGVRWTGAGTTARSGKRF